MTFVFSLFGAMEIKKQKLIVGLFTKDTVLEFIFSKKKKKKKKKKKNCTFSFLSFLLTYQKVSFF